eukprot:6193630-Pleurochrysis_carterae.AAC.3
MSQAWRDGIPTAAAVASAEMSPCILATSTVRSMISCKCYHPRAGQCHPDCRIEAARCAWLSG